ncbi:MFS transporter [Limnoglobus roseus]|uniref:MFS transporter n=1 Tax=Limnoglobus roseus TaxID=2598579 RepID=UPI00143D46A2|nr:MFS transporter [Limnoglobus roseus]
MSPARRIGRALGSRTFRSLRHPNYRLYFFGQLVSFLGSWVQSTAMMWLAYDLTNDPGWPAYLMVAQVGPTLLVGPIGGAVADHFPKRRVIQATQFAFMLNAMILTLLVSGDFVTPVLLVAMQFISGLIQGIDLPARLAVVTDLVPVDDVVNAVGLNSLLFNSARAVGPAIAGLFFVLAKGWADVSPGVDPTRWGAAACFAANSVSFLAVLLALSRIEVPAGPVKTERGSFWDGFRYLARHRGLAGLVLLTGCFCVFAWPVLTLFPAYTRQVLGKAEGTYSLLLSAFGGGALVGALTTATFGSHHRRGWFLVIGGAAGWVGLFVLLSATVLPLSMLACLFLGFGMVLYLSTGQSTLQTSVPNATRGRVMALWAMMLSASSLPGHLIAGELARRWPVPDVLLLMFGGVAVTMIGLAVLIASKPFPHQQ